MKITPCPKCGRIPKISEGISTSQNLRRRFIGCSNFCSVIPTDKHYWKDSWFLYIGNEDDNTIYKIWNEKVK